LNGVYDKLGIIMTSEMKISIDMTRKLARDKLKELLGC